MPPSRQRVANERADEVLDAVARVLLDVGYDRLTFDLVASSAKVGKATLYRRWSTKAHLVAAALESNDVCPLDAFDAATTGSLETDLAAMASGDNRALMRIPAIILAIAPAIGRDADLTEAFRTSFLEPRRERLVETLRAAQRRGEIGPDADLAMLASILPSLAMMHLVEHGTQPSDADMAHVIEAVVLPACRATLDTLDT